MIDLGKNRKFFLIPCLFLLASIPVYGQDAGVIRGIVKDQKTGKPIENVDVYIDNSTFGTTTDKSGHFELDHLPSGVFQLTATCVGYKPISRKVELGKSGFIQSSLTLKPQVYALNEVQVKGKIPQKWKQRLAEFKGDFFGDSKYADQCTIVNSQVLNFKRDKQSGALIAETNRILKILNKALGYRLNITLDSFTWNPYTDTGNYVIHPEFIKLKPTSKKQLKKWVTNRNRVYDHSFKHFLYALAHHETSREGYQYKAYLIPLKHDEAMFQLAKRGIYYNISFKGFRIAEPVKVQYDNEESEIMMNHQKYFFVDPNGNLLNPLSIIVSGAWSQDRVANLLPFTYHPKN